MINPRTTHLLIRHQEISLKGKNRPEFERRLKNNIRKYVSDGSGDIGEVRSASGRFVVAVNPGSTDVLKLVDRIATMSGVSAVTPCALLNTIDMKPVTAEALEWATFDLAQNPAAQTFAVRSRRVDKRYPLSSAQIDTVIGSQIKNMREGLTVNLKRPEIKISVEVRQRHTLIYSWEKSGIRGLPMDTTQRVVGLLSGGIDSPVAIYDVMRRGCTPILVHFHSKPFTSEASVTKVTKLATLLRGYSPHPLELWLVPLLEIQKAVRDSCNERYRTVHYRRFMMAIAQELANRRGAKALVTGEAIGQVASQTLTNMQAIEDVVSLPVLRPLVALDKDQIVAKAQQIGTYETSIEPHEDSCVLFAPLKPATQAKISLLREDEDLLPKYELVFRALDAAEKILV